VWKSNKNKSMLINYDLQHVDLSKTFEIHKFTVKKSLDNNLETQRERERAPVGLWFSFNT